MSARYLKLTRAQQTMLDRLVKSIEADLANIRSAPVRNDQVKYLKRLRALLFELRKAVDPKNKHFAPVMGLDTLEQLGAMFSMVKIAELSGDLRLHKLVKQTSKEPTSLQQLEADLIEQHQVAGIKHAQLMLFHQTERMLTHLDHWIALEKNKVGRPGNAEREYVIRRLAEACIDITGKKPSQSKDGALVKLSTEVLEHLFGTTRGVERAVERFMANHGRWRTR